MYLGHMQHIHMLLVELGLCNKASGGSLVINMPSECLSVFIKILVKGKSNQY